MIKLMRGTINIVLLVLCFIYSYDSVCVLMYDVFTWRDLIYSLVFSCGVYVQLEKLANKLKR